MPQKEPVKTRVDSQLPDPLSANSAITIAALLGLASGRTAQVSSNAECLSPSNSAVYSGGPAVFEFDSQFDAGGQDEISTVTGLFQTDPWLHQDILNYLGTRSLTEKIWTSGEGLVPGRRVQFVVIASFWMVSCGLGCLIGGICGGATDWSRFAQRITIKSVSGPPVSWLTVWAVGVSLLVLNFLLVNSLLWFSPLFRLVFGDWRQLREADKDD